MFKSCITNTLLKKLKPRPSALLRSEPPGKPFHCSIYRGCEPVKPILTLFTKFDCQLCDVALEELDPHLNKVQKDINMICFTAFCQVRLEEVDIEEEGNEEFYEKYRYEIPVFFLNKKFLCKNKINIELLLKTLDSER